MTLPHNTLSEFEALFVNAYIESNRDPCKAYKVACGDSFLGTDDVAAKMGRSLLQQPRVQQALSKIRDEIEEVSRQVTGMDRQWVMEQLKDLYDEARSDNDRRIALGCLEKIGKEFGMFIDRKEETKRIDLGSLTRQDMLALIRQMPADKLPTLIEQTPIPTAAPDRETPSN